MHYSDTKDKVTMRLEGLEEQKEKGVCWRSGCWSKRRERMCADECGRNKKEKGMLISYQTAAA